MTCQEVKITSDVFRTCLNHALTTKAEEVVGLLYGYQKILNKNGDYEVCLYGASCSARSCKEKDRVEIDPEELTMAMEGAEQLSKKIGVKTDVKGWYHSHPNITVFPSNVDIQTQYNLQQMGSDFVGLIFSCFSDNAQTMTSKIDVIAFQSYREDTLRGKTIKVNIVPHYDLINEKDILTKYDYLDNMSKIQEILVVEEDSAYQEAKNCQKKKNSLKHVFNSTQHILNYSRILEIISLPFNRCIDVLEKNNESLLRYIKKENEVLQQYLDSMKNYINKS